MTSSEEKTAEAKGPKGSKNNKLHAFLQNEELTQRIVSDLEQLNYAQILTSLATGSLQSNNQLNNPGVKAEKRELSHANVEKQSEFLPQKRLVKPSRKIRELQEIYNGKTHATKKRTKISEVNKGLCGITSDKKRATSGVNKGYHRITGSKRKATFGVTKNFHGQEVDRKFQGQRQIVRKKSGENEAAKKDESSTKIGTSCITNKNMRAKSDPENALRRQKAEIEEQCIEKGVSKESKKVIYDEKIEEISQKMAVNQSGKFKESTVDSRGSDEKCPHECDQCGRRFKTYYTFSIHIRMPDHTKEAPFVCDVCGKGFRLSSTLCRHKIIHTSKKPHQCSVCEKTFNRSSTLKMHMRTHCARKQHVCSTCGKGFHQKGNLRNHMFVHSGERPFCCETCGRQFNKKSNLKHHLKIHELKGRYWCTDCKKVFQEKAALKDHMKDKHSHL